MTRSSSKKTNQNQKHRRLPTPEDLKGLPSDGGPDYNRLIFEKSPYLLQHAGNPVDWYSWGEEAFQQAKQQNKPIFLSIGYSTCHWCHVMEEESFEDPEVAALLNDTFIPVKVDREERPDLDQIYMSVCQSLTGSGGWPLTVLLTPDKKPFFAGTYFPKETRFQRIGMLDLIPKVEELWINKKSELIDSAEHIVNSLQQAVPQGTGEVMDDSIFEEAYQQLKESFDSRYGGFGRAPKFPTPHNLTFLLRFWHRTREPYALEMVEQTLQKMRLGGIYDQIGFGFHRYSTDPSWILPHFEKMLYDQATLVLAYCEVYHITRNEFYAQTVREILDYVLRDLTSPEGGFYSAEDADSEGEEGLFYLWTIQEFRQYLGNEGSKIFIDLFNLEEEGNFFEESTKRKTGRNILYLAQPLAESANMLNLSEKDLLNLWERTRTLLFDIRKERIHPFKDDKILTDWNGLMIAAFAKASSILDEPKYVLAAQRAADFIWENLRDSKGKLLKRYRGGDAGLPAHLDDYAFLIRGLLELYDAVFDTVYLERALYLTEIMIQLFWDADQGGFFFSAEDQEDLIVKTKEIYDGAIPSGNSLAAGNLIRIGRMTANTDYLEKASLIGRPFGTQINQVPIGYTEFLSAYTNVVGPAYEVVIAGDPNADDTKAMIKALKNEYLPSIVTLFRPSNEIEPPIIQLSRFLKDQLPIDGKATAYVCQDFTCNAPTTDIDEMLKNLRAHRAPE